MLAYQRTSPRTAAHARRVQSRKMPTSHRETATPTKDTNAITFPWEQPCSPSTKASMLESRRNRLRTIMQDHAQEGDSVQLKRIAMEWNALTEARDRQTRQQFDRELKLQHSEKVLALRDMLEELCTAAPFDSNDHGIKLGMYELLTRIRAHCASNAITKEGCTHLRVQADCWKKAIEAASAPPPPPPPPPPPMPPSFNLPTAKPRLNITKSKQNREVSFRSPLKQMNGDILAAISTKGRSALKQTPYKLSPGGTPHRSRMETADPITNALRTKFRNVHIHSPMGMGSPNVYSPLADSPAIESSGSTPYAEPVFFVDKSQPLPRLALQL